MISNADWIVTAALNAFKAYEWGGFGSVQRFVTIGTGCGTDVIAALDTFPDLKDVSLRDIHEDVVKVVKRNVLSATGKGKRFSKRYSGTSCGKGRGHVAAACR